MLKGIFSCFWDYYLTRLCTKIHFHTVMAKSDVWRACLVLMTLQVWLNREISLASLLRNSLNKTDKIMDCDPVWKKNIFAISRTPNYSTALFQFQVWRGWVCDKHVTENNGLFNNLLPEDLVLADCGFTNRQQCKTDVCRSEKLFNLSVCVYSPYPDTGNVMGDAQVL